MSQLTSPVVASPVSTSACSLKIALFGFGTVGSSVARILVESAPAGLTLTHIVNRNVDRKRVDWIPNSVVWSDDPDSVLTKSATSPDVIVELAGGLEPAGAWVRKALAAGISVVTANKKLIAFHGLEWGSPPRTARTCLRAAVAGGIPVIPGLEHSCRRPGQRVEGIPQRHPQFHPQQHGAGCRLCPAPGEAQRARLRRGGPYGRRCRVRCIAAGHLDASGSARQVHPEDIQACPSPTLRPSTFPMRATQLHHPPDCRAERLGICRNCPPYVVPFSSPLAWSRCRRTWW